MSEWVLKGGTGMLARIPDSRATKDIDLFATGASLRCKTHSGQLSDWTRDAIARDNSKLFMDKWGAASAPRGSAGGGAALRFREGISVGTELDGRALPVSPRY